MTLKSLITTVSVATVLVAVPAVAPSTMTAMAPTAAYACDNALEIECDLPDGSCPGCPEPPPPDCGEKGGPTTMYCELPLSIPYDPDALPTTIAPTRERTDDREPTRR